MVKPKPMNDMNINLRAQALAKMATEIKKVETWLDDDEGWASQGAIDEATQHIQLLDSLKTVLELPKTDYWLGGSDAEFHFNRGFDSAIEAAHNLIIEGVLG